MNCIGHFDLFVSDSQRKRIETRRKWMSYTYVSLVCL